MRIMLVCLALTWGSFTRPAQADDAKQKAHHLYEAGMKFYNVGDYPRALEAFKNGYYANPDPAFLFNMGQCDRMLGDAENEVRHYRAFLRVNPDAPNREDVEHFIKDAEEQLRRKAADRPPTGVEPPKTTATEPRTVTDAATTTKEEPVVITSTEPPPKPFYRRSWFWITIGAVVVAAAVAGIVVAFVTPANAPVGMTDLGAMRIHF